MKIEYRVCDICGNKMDVLDYYVIKIDNKSKKKSLKGDWKWQDCCNECKEEVEKVIKQRAKTKCIEFK